MTALVWDQAGTREFETGLDRGVLYLADGAIVPWSGLTSVTEDVKREASAVYYDGMKINTLIDSGEFSGSVKAITYPDELDDLEGVGHVRFGTVIGEQPPKSFDFSYRTLVGNDLNSDAGYKIHLVYNAFLVPKERTRETLSADGSPLEFEWDIYAIPEEIPGFAPSAHLIISSLDTDPWLMEDFETMLYGTASSDPFFLPLADMFEYLSSWARIRIVDNGDGTWTATDERDAYITVNEDDEFEIIDANAVFLDDDTYVIDDLVT